MLVVIVPVIRAGWENVYRSSMKICRPYALFINYKVIRKVHVTMPLVVVEVAKAHSDGLTEGSHLVMKRERLHTHPQTIYRALETLMSLTTLFLGKCTSKMLSPGPLEQACREEVIGDVVTKKCDLYFGNPDNNLV